jgi:hypothetical protein
MAADELSSFHCPNCDALYQVVKVDAGPETVAREITCRCCETPLIGREGNLVVKYFLQRKAERVQKGATRQPIRRRAKTVAAVIEGV